MHQLVDSISASEGTSGEHALLRGDTRPLRTATGFVFGGALSGALWSVVGMLAWYLA